MRSLILAFAAGISVLQMQPVLPGAELWALAGGMMMLPRWRWSNVMTRWLAVFGCVLLGFAWAAWRAEIRLADTLPTAWEGRDIELQGVIASLPQDFSHGTRFEFVVEKSLTAGTVVPARIMLSR